MRIFTFLVVLLFAQIQNAGAQLFIYPNDVCTGAIPLPVGNTSELSDSIFQRVNYADIAISPIPDCAGTSNVRHDLWYSFIAPASTIAIVPEYYQGFYQLFSGTCGALVSMACNTNGNIFPPLTGLTPGQLYYLRMYTRTQSPLTAGSTNFSLTLLTAPLNDLCSNATLLPVSPLPTQVAVLKSFTNELATESLDNSCGPLIGNSWMSGSKDIWFRFVATNAVHSILVRAPQLNTFVEAYGGAPGSLARIGTAFASSSFIQSGVISLTGLTQGQTYYIRAGGPGNLKFDLGITTGKPANDECVNADTLLMSNSLNCENLRQFRRIGATNSTAPCPTSSTGDVWFVFHATAPDINIRTTSDNNYVIPTSILSGNCSALSCLASNTGNVLAYNGLTVGNYYYIKAGGSVPAAENFTICLTPGLTNDNCSGAITLPVNPFGLTRAISRNTFGATPTTANCAGDNRADVWFKFVATDTAVGISSDSDYPSVFQVFSGSCGSLTSIFCTDNSTLLNDETQRTERVGGLTPGAEYFVRYMAFGADDFFTMDINALPANDQCPGAINLTSKTSISYEDGFDNGIRLATASMAPCAATSYPQDLWYKFTATGTTAAVTSDLKGTVIAPNTLGIQVLSGTCGSLSPIVCFQQGNLSHAAQTISGLTPGQTYYLRQYGNVNNNRISILAPPKNDHMQDAARLTPAPATVQLIPSYYTHGASRQTGKICSSTSLPIYNDVWFYFVAENASYTVTANTTNSYSTEEMLSYTYRLETFRGYAGDSLQLVGKFISCGSNTLMVNGLNAGDTIYVRVSNTAGENNTSIFSMKVSSSTSIDEPSGALALTKTDDFQYLLSTAGASQSMPAMNCNITDFPDDDIWLKFTASPDARRVIAGYENIGITIQLFSGTPGSLTPLKCSNNIMVLPSDLVIGQVYYLRMYSKVAAQAAQFRVGLYGQEAMEPGDCATDRCVGPNLVANPSLESSEPFLLPQNDETISVPGRKLTTGWYNGNTYTADAWDADYPTGDWANLPGDLNGASTKIPRSGKGMLGVLSWGSGSWHEYVSGKLTQPLVKGKTYLVSFYVSVAEFSEAKEIPLIGANFSNDSITGGYALEYLPQISNALGEPVTNITGWRKICGLYTAQEAYSFITIGHFGPENIYNSALKAYFYLEDVMVAEAPICGTPLPLTLLEFKGVRTSLGQSELSWKTADEYHASRFDVEWSTDAVAFGKIGTVAASGSTSSVANYSFVHASPGTGVNYYRLKMIDLDGRFTYSSVVRLGGMPGGSSISAYPNPVNGSLQVSVQSARNQLASFSLISSDGRVVENRQVMLREGSNLFSWDMSRFAKGYYFLTSDEKAVGAVKVLRD